MEFLSLDYLLEQLDFLLRIFLASAVGAAIGYERKNRNKGAGVRTHAIVALGAALTMVISKYGFGDVPGHDGARVAAQVVSGIGFLGAGIIFVRNNTVSGLTTAAGIWATAAVGMCFGSGLYFLAAMSGLMIIAIQIIMHRIPFFAREAHIGRVKIILRNEEGIKEFQDMVGNRRVELLSMKVHKEEAGAQIDAEVIYPHGCNKWEFLEELAMKEELTYIKG